MLFVLRRGGFETRPRSLSLNHAHSVIHALDDTDIEVVSVCGT